MRESGTSSVRCPISGWACGRADPDRGSPRSRTPAEEWLALTLGAMRPPAIPSGWLLGTIAQFDALTDLANLVIARLAEAAADGNSAASNEIIRVRRGLREVDPRDATSITTLASSLSQRAAELGP